MNFLVLNGIGQTLLPHIAATAHNLRPKRLSPIPLAREEQIRIHLGAQRPVHPRLPIQREHSDPLQSCTNLRDATLGYRRVVDVIAFVDAVEVDSFVVAQLAAHDVGQFVSPISHFLQPPRARLPT
jgi:hypothetical protein